MGQAQRCTGCSRTQRRYFQDRSCPREVVERLPQYSPAELEALLLSPAAVSQ